MRFDETEPKPSLLDWVLRLLPLWMITPAFYEVISRTYHDGDMLFEKTLGDILNDLGDLND